MADQQILPAGTQLNGKYRIVSHLSSGGFGNTYLASYGRQGAKVAIKELFMSAVNLREADGVTVSVSSGKEDSDIFHSQLKKFKKEYDRLKQISNPHVVKVLDCFNENGTAYYVMEFVDGEDLSSRLKQRGKPYAEITVQNYLKGILDGLGSIHSAGLLHLDIKPQNIMVDSRHHQVTLIDLGASKDDMEGAGATVLTGIAMTNRYAPPEQIDGSFEKIGPWTDFYALGATLYYLLTCQEVPTFTNISEDCTSDKHIALPMPGVSQSTRALVVWMMSLNRANRPQNVGQILSRLGQKGKAPRNSGYGGETVVIGGSGRGNAGGTVGKRTIQSGGNRPTPPPLKEEMPEFSIVGAIYIVVIIAIIVYVIKLLFF